MSTLGSPAKMVSLAMVRGNTTLAMSRDTSSVERTSKTKVSFRPMTTFGGGVGMRTSTAMLGLSYERQSRIRISQCCGLACSEHAGGTR